MLEIKRAKVRFYIAFIIEYRYNEIENLSIFDKRGEKMARKEFETLTPQMFYILLSLYEPLCGLEIMEKVNEMTEGDVSVGAGTLYALLPRFENIGYIQLLKEENKRKIYIITQKGKERLELEKEKMQKQIILFMKKDYEDEI